jgi:hypothetical protein
VLIASCTGQALVLLPRSFYATEHAEPSSFSSSSSSSSAVLRVKSLTRASGSERDEDALAAARAEGAALPRAGPVIGVFNNLRKVQLLFCGQRTKKPLQAAPAGRPATSPLPPPLSAAVQLCRRHFWPPTAPPDARLRPRAPGAGARRGGVVHASRGAARRRALGRYQPSLRRARTPPPPPKVFPPTPPLPCALAGQLHEAWRLALSAIGCDC